MANKAEIIRNACTTMGERKITTLVARQQNNGHSCWHLIWKLYILTTLTFIFFFSVVKCKRRFSRIVCSYWSQADRLFIPRSVWFRCRMMKSIIWQACCRGGAGADGACPNHKLILLLIKIWSFTSIYCSKMYYDFDPYRSKIGFRSKINCFYG